VLIPVFGSQPAGDVNHKGRLKMRDMNLRHQFARVEIAGHENAGPYLQEWKMQDMKTRDQFCTGGKYGKS